MFTRLKRHKVATGIAVGVSVTFYVILMQYIPTDGLQNVNLSYLYLACLASLAVYCMRSIRVKMLYPQFAWMNILLAVATQTFLLRILPMRLGEFGLAVLLEKQEKLSLGQGSILLVWLRLSEVCVLLIACVCAWYYLNHSLQWSLLFYGAIVLMALYYSLSIIKMMCQWVNHLLSNTPEKPYQIKIQNLCQNILDTENLSRTNWVYLLLSSLCIMILQCCLFYTMIRACNSDVSWMALVIGSGFAHIAGAVPAPTLGNVGTHESAWVMGFTLVGMSLEHASLSAVVSQGFTMLCAGMWLVLIVILQRFISKMRFAQSNRS